MMKKSKSKTSPLEPGLVEWLGPRHIGGKGQRGSAIAIVMQRGIATLTLKEVSAIRELETQYRQDPRRMRQADPE